MIRVWVFITIASCWAAFVGVAWLRGTLPAYGGLTRTGKVIGAAVSVGFIFIATLVPAGGSDDSKLRPNPVAGLDELQAAGNVALFVPLGGLLALMGMSRLAAVTVAVALSLLIETLQFFFVEGRYAATGDVILNTIGAVMGHLVFAPRTSGAVGSRHRS